MVPAFSVAGQTKKENKGKTYFIMYPGGTNMKNIVSEDCSGNTKGPLKDIYMQTLNCFQQEEPVKMKRKSINQ